MLESSRWRLLFPFLGIAIFTALFDLSVEKPFPIASLDRLSIDALTFDSGMMILLLGGGLLVVASVIALVVTFLLLKDDQVWGDMTDRRFYLPLIPGVAIGFLIYNFVLDDWGISHFVSYTKGLFDNAFSAAGGLPNGRQDILFTWLYYGTTTVAIVAAAALAVAVMWWGRPRGAIRGSTAEINRMKNRRSMIDLALFAAALLLSSYVVYLFSWHNMIRTMIVDDDAARAFSAFMFAFSSYWGLAYCTVVVGGFGPIVVAYNRDLDGLVESLVGSGTESPKSALERILLAWIKPTDFSYIVTAISPLLAGLGANAISLLVSSY